MSCKNYEAERKSPKLKKESTLVVGQKPYGKSQFKAFVSPDRISRMLAGTTIASMSANVYVGFAVIIQQANTTLFFRL
jgi:hypothetical protein